MEETQVLQLPAETLKKFNWGALLLNWIWGLGNKTYLPLIILPIAFIPILGPLANLGLAIWFGFKGNEWAWQNKQWQSVEHFDDVQKKWAIAGAIIWAISLVLTIFSWILLGAAYFMGGVQ